MLKNILIFVGGLAAGAITGIVVARKQMQDEFDKQVNEEVEEFKKEYKRHVTEDLLGARTITAHDEKVIADYIAKQNGYSTKTSEERPADPEDIPDETWELSEEELEDMDDELKQAIEARDKAHGVSYDSEDEEEEKLVLKSQEEFDDLFDNDPEFNSGVAKYYRDENRVYLYSDAPVDVPDHLLAVCDSADDDSTVYLWEPEWHYAYEVLIKPSRYED